MAVETMTIEQAYGLLGVETLASVKRVKQSFRRAAKRYHPDVSSGRVNIDKFHKVVTAYETILEYRKNQPPNTVSRAARGAGRKRPAPSNTNHSNKGFKNKNGATAKAKHKGKAGRPARKSRPVPAYCKGKSNLLSYEELVIRFDNSPSRWVKIETAASVFKRFETHFESFAIPRMLSAPTMTLLFFIRSLGIIGSYESLSAITPYLSSADKKVCCATFVALDKAGGLGCAILDKYLETPPAILYGLTGLFFRTDLERKVLDLRLVSSEKLRRLSAVEKKTGLPLRDLLEGIGVPFSQPA